MSKLNRIISGFKNPATRGMYTAAAIGDLTAIVLAVVSLLRHNGVLLLVTASIYAVIYIVVAAAIAEYSRVTAFDESKDDEESYDNYEN